MELEREIIMKKEQNDLRRYLKNFQNNMQCRYLTNVLIPFTSVTLQSLQVVLKPSVLQQFTLMCVVESLAVNDNHMYVLLLSAVN